MNPVRRMGAASRWVAAILASIAIVGIGYFAGSRNTAPAPAAEKKLEKIWLSKTKGLAKNKQRSLETYNQEISTKELLNFYRLHTGRSLSQDAYSELDRLMMQDVVRMLWLQCSESEASDTTILHRAMVESIHHSFPHKTLTNADVILFPDDSKLRCIVSEPASDFFRDTARHWKWIADWTELVSDDERSADFKELDAYAAEELSEFLSVLAVGVVQLAAEDSNDGELNVGEVQAAFAKIKQYSPDVVLPETRSVGFSDSVKLELQKQMPTKLFEESSDSGIDFVHTIKPQHQEARTRLAIPLGIAGGGVSVGDSDGDDLLDVYLAGDGGGALFRNLGAGKFEDATKAAGIKLDGESRAGYFVDYDNDGDQDLFITFVGAPNRLLNNNGEGTFVDVSKEVGLMNEDFVSHEAVWFDMNNDGLLELYVGNFGQWLAGHSPTIGRINSNAPPNRLYIQQVVDGEHKFVESSAKLGVDDRGWTHCVGVCDVDLDGWPDLFSINDFGASKLFRNIEGKRFEEASKEFHLDDIYNGMSFTLLDLNHNSNFSIYVSQIMKLTHRQRYSRPSEATKVQFDPTKKDNLRVLVNNRLFNKAFESSYRDDHNFLIEPAKLGWSWDVSGLDYENDSDLDLLVLNGTESLVPTNLSIKNRNYIGGRSYLAQFDREQNRFFIQEDGYFYDWSEQNPVAFPGNSRGSSFFDADDDGDLDIVVSNYDAASKVFINLQDSGNNWVNLKLQGTKSNRNAIGAVVEIKFDGQSRFGVVVSGSGFLSQNPYALHFGLGKAERIDQVIVKWPSGIVQEIDGLEINSRHVVVEQE